MPTKKQQPNKTTTKKQTVRKTRKSSLEARMQAEAEGFRILEPKETLPTPDQADRFRWVESDFQTKRPFDPERAAQNLRIALKRDEQSE